MKINSANLDAFYNVSQHLSFSLAARDLGLTQSALSQRVMNLESFLETKLFVREPGAVRLTDAGDELLRYCQMQAAMEAEVLGRLSVSQGLSGIIRIGGFSSVVRSFIMPKLSALLTQHPQVKIELSTNETYELPSMLRTGKIDFMIMDVAQDKANLISETIGHEESVLVEAKNLKVERKNIYLDHDMEDRTTYMFLEAQGKKKNNEISRLFLGDIYGILDGAALGWGRAVVPKHLLAEKKNLQIVPGFRILKTPIVLHYYQQPYYSKLHKVVLECLRQKDYASKAGH